jgi:serine/threonine-protein kinase
MIAHPDLERVMEASFAVLIGVGRYAHEGPALRPLTCPVKDVEAVAAALIEDGFLPRNIWKLCDDSASLVGVWNAFLEVTTLARKIRRERGLQQIRLFIYYSGHGRIGMGSRGEATTFLCMWDSAAEAELLPVTALDGERLNTLVAGIAPDQEVRFLDCCHAAGVGGAKGGDHDLMTALMSSMAKARGRGIIYACEHDELAWECRDGRNSVFAQALIDGLRHGARDLRGVVHVGALAAYLSLRVPELARQERNVKQTPVLELTQIDGEMPVVFRAQAFARSCEVVARAAQRIETAVLSERERDYCRELLSRWPDPSNADEGRRIAFLLEAASMPALDALQTGVRSWLTPSTGRPLWSSTSALGRPPPGYQLISVEHKSGARAVFFALRESDGALCVVKTLENGSAFEREHFEQEARLLGRLRSAYLPRLMGYEHEPDTGRAVIIMERAPGEDLDRALAGLGGVALPLRSVIDILRQTSEALEDLQTAGVVHRDLKPKNIVGQHLGEDRWGIKVVDLGIARDAEQTHGTHQLEWIGTRMWMAPEQTDRRPATAATDVYALGLLAYWLLAGEPYWEVEYLEASGDPRPLFAAVQHGAGEPASARARRRRSVELPVTFDAVFSRAVARRPEDRYANASDFFAAFVVALSQPSGPRALTASLPPASPPPEEPDACTPVTGLSVDPPIRPQVVQRRGRLLPLGVLSLALLLGGGGVVSMLDRVSPESTPSTYRLPIAPTAEGPPRPAAPAASATTTPDLPTAHPAPPPAEVAPRLVGSPPPMTSNRSAPQRGGGRPQGTHQAHARVLDCKDRHHDDGQYKLWTTTEGEVYFAPVETTLRQVTKGCADFMTRHPR